MTRIGFCSLEKQPCTLILRPIYLLHNLIVCYCTSITTVSFPCMFRYPGSELLYINASNMVCLLSCQCIHPDRQPTIVHCYKTEGEIPVPTPVPEFIDPVITKTSPKLLFSVIEKKLFGLVFAKSRSIIWGTDTAGRQWSTTGKYFQHDSGVNTCFASEVFNASGIFPRNTVWKKVKCEQHRVGSTRS